MFLVEMRSVVMAGVLLTGGPKAGDVLVNGIIDGKANTGRI
jgi:hypothetical protein